MLASLACRFAAAFTSVKMEWHFLVPAIGVQVYHLFHNLHPPQIWAESSSMEKCWLGHSENSQSFLIQTVLYTEGKKSNILTLNLLQGKEHQHFAASIMCVSWTNLTSFGYYLHTSLLFQLQRRATNFRLLKPNVHRPTIRIPSRPLLWFLISSTYLDEKLAFILLFLQCMPRFSEGWLLCRVGNSMMQNTHSLGLQIIPPTIISSADVLTLLFAESGLWQGNWVQQSWRQVWRVRRR